MAGIDVDQLLLPGNQPSLSAAAPRRRPAARGRQAPQLRNRRRRQGALRLPVGGGHRAISWPPRTAAAPGCPVRVNSRRHARLYYGRPSRATPLLLRAW